jgi:hypothetical protein
MKVVTFTAGFAIAMALLLQPVFTQAKPVTISGHLVDVMCATHHAEEGAAYGAKHDKKCLLMDECVKSGYSVLQADKTVVKLDQKGNELALALIKKTDRESDWRVNVTGTVSNGTIAVSSLTLQ